MDGTPGRVHQTGNIFRHMIQLLGSQPPGDQSRRPGTGRLTRNLDPFAGGEGSPQACDSHTQRSNWNHNQRKRGSEGR